MLNMLKGCEAGQPEGYEPANAEGYDVETPEGTERGAGLARAERNSSMYDKPHT